MVAIQSIGEARRRCPCFVWQLSQLRVFCCKRRQGQQQNMVDLSSSGLGNSKHTASPSYHAQWFELSINLCATWVWHSLSRRGISSPHCAASAVMNSGFTLNTQCHGLIIDTQGRNEVIWSSSHLLIWHHLFSSHRGTLTKERMSDKIALSKLCFLVFIFLWILA
jgi:hypothetical protein